MFLSVNDVVPWYFLYYELWYVLHGCYIFLEFI